jgi:hypothetical protein
MPRRIWTCSYPASDQTWSKFTVSYAHGTRRERIEGVGVAGRTKAELPGRASHCRVLITQHTVTFAIDDDPAVVGKRVPETLRTGRLACAA